MQNIIEITIKRILEAEAQVTDRVTLYYEGIFWKAYERSAFLVCSQIRAFKPTKKFVKKMGGREVVSIGFPDTSLETLMQGRQKASEAHISLTYAGFRPLNEQEFIQWKNKSGALPYYELPVYKTTRELSNACSNASITGGM